MTFEDKTLETLTQNGRATWADMAEDLGISAPAAADRVRRLEERGVIVGYTAVLNAEAIGYPLTAFVAVSVGGLTHRERFLELVQEIDEVTECHHLTGNDDYLLKIRCRGTKDLERVIVERLNPIPDVVRTRTSIVLSTLKETIALTSAPEKPSTLSRVRR